MTDPMLRGAEALATLQEIARTPNHMRQLLGKDAQDILIMVELYRTVIAQNQITEQELIGVRSALALHHSMVLSDEQPGPESRKQFSEAMDTLKRIKKGLEIAKCCDCRVYHNRDRMKVMESFQQAGEMDPKDWTLMCLSCWQAALQSELGGLRVYAGRVLRDAEESSSSLEGVGDSIRKLREYMDTAEKRWLGEAHELLKVERGGNITGKLPCGHDVSNIIAVAGEAPYCKKCWNS